MSEEQWKGFVSDAAYVRREEIGDTQAIQQRLTELTGLAEKKRQDELRTLIREELHRALFPGGLPDAHRHRRVRLIEENGTEWRGTLYATEESTISEETPESKEHQG